jgi:hypothetical protein
MVNACWNLGAPATRQQCSRPESFSGLFCTRNQTKQHNKEQLMRRKVKSAWTALVAALAAMAFGSSAYASSDQYAWFNQCPDEESERGGESHQRVNCKGKSTCYVGSSFPEPVTFQGARARLENPLLGSSDTRRHLLDGVQSIASRAGRGRERAYVVAIGHACA